LVSSWIAAPEVKVWLILVVLLVLLRLRERLEALLRLIHILLLRALFVPAVVVLLEIILLLLDRLVAWGCAQVLRFL